MTRLRSLACLALFLLVFIGACVEAARVPATSTFEDWNDERLEAALFEKSSELPAAPFTAEPSPAGASTKPTAANSANNAPIETATIALTRRGATLLESGAAPTAAATAAPTHAATPTPTAASTHAIPTVAAKPTPTTAAFTAAPTIAATKAPSNGAAAASPTKNKAKGTHECVVPTDRVSTFAAFHTSLFSAHS